ncbi:hypothetical protein RHIZO_04506 [Rhizobiaceae bacterium]|nr:hypothetical protein RHIZO_04506 [Rhizobiaceae bacterium]
MVERTVMPTSPPSVEYALNELGRRLVPAIKAIAEVGEELQRRAADDAIDGGETPRLKDFRATRAREAAQER